MADGIPEFLELIFATLMNCEPEKWLNSYALCVKCQDIVDKKSAKTSWTKVL